jgi:hypothetical protein
MECAASSITILSQRECRGKAAKAELRRSLKQLRWVVLHEYREAVLSNQPLRAFRHSLGAQKKRGFYEGGLALPVRHQVLRTACRFPVVVTKKLSSP